MVGPYQLTKHQCKQDLTVTNRSSAADTDVEVPRRAAECVGCDKVQQWVGATGNCSQPHAAHAAFTHGMSKWTYLIRTLPRPFAP